jgi:acyl CoA:acetate/3-ketoacid CoA transferase alpha subunit
MAKQALGSILDQFIEQAKQPGKCCIASWISSLPKEEAQKFESLKTENTRVPIKNLYEALVAAGVELPGKLTAFRSHFKGYCTCK